FRQAQPLRYLAAQYAGLAPASFAGDHQHQPGVARAGAAQEPQQRGMRLTLRQPMQVETGVDRLLDGNRRRLGIHVRRDPRRRAQRRDRLGDGRPQHALLVGENAAPVAVARTHGFGLCSAAVVAACAGALSAMMSFGRGLVSGTLIFSGAAPLTDTSFGISMTNLPNCLMRPAMWGVSSPWPK